MCLLNFFCSATLRITYQNNLSATKTNLIQAMLKVFFYPALKSSFSFSPLPKQRMRPLPTKLNASPRIRSQNQIKFNIAATNSIQRPQKVIYQNFSTPSSLQLEIGLNQSKLCGLNRRRRRRELFSRVAELEPSFSWTLRAGAANLLDGSGEALPLRKKNFFEALFKLF